MTQILKRQCYIKDDLCYIPLNNGQEAFTDKEFYDKVSKYNWCINRGYAMAYINKKQTYLTRLLFPDIQQELIRINLNRMDNRKCNFKHRECYIKDNICYIPLQNGKEAICDADRFDEVKCHHWNEHRGYAETYKNNKPISLHRLLYPQWKIIDHKNRNKLDNTSVNLRPATMQQNVVNQGVSKVNTSGYKGVRIVGNKFVARIRINGKKTHLGTYNTKEDAALAYNDKAKELFGEYAYLNIINY